MDFVIGNNSVTELVKYELLTCFLSNIPGALGLFLRKKFFPLLMGATGRGVIFGKNCTIRHPTKVYLGDNVVFDDFVLIDARGHDTAGILIGDNTIIGRNVTLIAKTGQILIGNNCNIGASSVIVSQGGVTIKDWVGIAGGCEISGGAFKLKKNQVDNETPFERYTKGPVVIEEKCFIGGNSMVLDGVKIGKESLIGTGSIVMSNIPDNSVYMPKPGMIIAKSN